LDSQRGYSELPHTADWVLQVWGQSYADLLVTAAEGMYSLLGLEPRSAGDEQIEFSVQGRDAESRLVNFLDELLFLLERDRILVDEMVIDQDGETLTVKGRPVSVDEQRKEIKAVTYYQLKIEEADNHLKIQITFDV
jgi:SHS2 domain-containing protein